MKISKITNINGEIFESFIDIEEDLGLSQEEWDNLVFDGQDKVLEAYLKDGSIPIFTAF